MYTHKHIVVLCFWLVILKTNPSQQTIWKAIWMYRRSTIACYMSKKMRPRVQTPLILRRRIHQQETQPLTRLSTRFPEHPNEMGIKAHCRPERAAMSSWHVTLVFYTGERTGWLWEELVTDADGSSYPATTGQAGDKHSIQMRCGHSQAGASTSVFQDGLVCCKDSILWLLSDVI